MVKIVDRSGPPALAPLFSPAAPAPDVLEILYVNDSGTVCYQKFEKQLVVRGNFGKPLSQKDMLLSPQGQQQLGYLPQKTNVMVPTRSLSAAAYVEELVKDLSIEYANAAEQKSIDQFLKGAELAITIASILQPELVVLRAAAVVFTVKSLIESFENGEVAKFLTVEILSFCVGKYVKEFMFIGKPGLRLKRRELEAMKFKNGMKQDVASETFKTSLEACFDAFETKAGNPQAMSPSIRKLIEVHMFRIEHDKAYIVQCKKAAQARAAAKVSLPTSVTTYRITP